MTTATISVPALHPALHRAPHPAPHPAPHRAPRPTGRPTSRPRTLAGARPRPRPVTATTTTTTTEARPSRAVYRRRRVSVAVLGALVVLAGARTADAVVAGSGPAVHATQHLVHYHVRPGDTLWSIAQRLAPGSDPRAVVDMLVQAHGGPTIQPGDVIDWAGS